MATLKISDLSVGDWVRWKVYDKTYDMQVSGVTDRRIYGLHDGIEYSMLLTQICPIPITAEILEKNGWKLSKSNWFEFEDGEWKINIWIGKSKCNIEISQKREIYMSTYADIQVVKSNINTIQHALRLAGVDKEINL